MEARCPHKAKVVGSTPISALLLSYCWRNKNESGENKIIRISKREMEFLVKNGVRYNENGIITTTGHTKNWYLTEDKNSMKLLNYFRKSRVIEK